MFLLSKSLKKHRRDALTILESLVLLVTSAILALVVVPVVLMNYGYIKSDEQPLVTSPPTESTGASELKPIPQLAIPESPKLPPDGNSVGK